jgi:predicted nuclease with TOPRIM domain
MGIRTSEYLKGVHDIPHQGNIRHSTGTATVYQQLDGLVREKERLQKQRRMWSAKARRLQERIAQLDAQARALLTTLEPLIREAEEEVPYALPLPD